MLSLLLIAPLPLPSDLLHITCGDKPLFTDFFSAKLRGSQVFWLPCEVEVLFIAIPAKHFSPYIIQSHNNAFILTDNKRCIQAFEKLFFGEVTTSLHISTFLSFVKLFPGLCYTHTWLYNFTI